MQGFCCETRCIHLRFLYANLHGHPFDELKVIQVLYNAVPDFQDMVLDNIPSSFPNTD